MNELIKAYELGKTYQRGVEEIFAVRGINLTIQEGEFLAITGASGSGKTTLLHLLGCLDNPSTGELYLDNKAIYKNGKPLKEKKLTLIRAQYFGYIFQKFYLIPTLSVKENILLPQAFFKPSQPGQNVYDLAKSLGIDHRMNHLPKEISGGEMQRVAIARALINNPKILLADEPTGNLDSTRSAEISSILTDLNRNKGITIVLVTHNPELAKCATRSIVLKDGVLLE